MLDEREVDEKYGVASVRCRWLPGDEVKAWSDEVIRVVEMGHWWYADDSPSMANVAWQPGVLWKVLPRRESSSPARSVSEGLPRSRFGLVCGSSVPG